MKNHIYNTSLGNWKRAILKVGSTIVAPGGKGFTSQYSLPIADFINQCREKGKEIILVSSGAVASGISTQPKLQKKGHITIPEKQALAAIGQSLLMQNWNRYFDFPCAQVLLTYDGLYNRERFINAKNTINELLMLNTLPIVNENDTVAVEELMVGDNDNLAAHVAVLAEADLLIIGSDIDGVYDSDPSINKNAKLISTIEKIDDSIYEAAGDSLNPLSKGGMKTKIQAAQKAASRGIDTVILNATKREVLDDLLIGKINGTIIKRTKTPMAAKKHWLQHTLPSSGNIIIDEGAKEAILNTGASLLPSGIKEIEGKFTNGDAVDLEFKSGSNKIKIAKGITQYNSDALKIIKGSKSNKIEELLGYFNNEVVIHRDDLVIINN